MAGVSLAALLLVLSPAAFWPQEYSALAARFLTPWTVSGGGLGYTLEVTSGNPPAARGRVVTLTAKVNPVNDKATLPGYCTLVILDANGKSHEERMTADNQTHHSFGVKVEDSFTYYVKAGDAVSDSFSVTAVTPVELADGPTINVTPPKYAEATMEKQTMTSMKDIAALQHSAVKLECRFTAPATSALLIWTEHAAEKATPKVNELPLTLNADHLGGTLELPCAASALRLPPGSGRRLRHQDGRRLADRFHLPVTRPPSSSTFPATRSCGPFTRMTP